MTKRLVLLVAGLWWLGPVIFAHRLDEYLQATTIDVRKDQIILQLRLAAGVEVATTILANLDPNGDGHLSATEQQAYAQHVCDHLSLVLDGRAIPLRLIRYSFPPVEAIKKGIGNILLSCQVDLKPGDTTHQLTFRNQYQRTLSSYLVNCLLPSDPSIHIFSQHRSYDQSVYQLAFSTGLGSQASVDPQSWTSGNNRLAVMKTYFYHGIGHILSGYDHLLFICALLLGAKRLWDLVKIVTAFTVAHSISLVLAVYQWVHLPSSLVELFISASIIFVAVQNIYWSQSAQAPSRLAVAFFFGLFHGLGFAGGLLVLMQALPKTTAVAAIGGFSVGVEVGHQLVLLPLFFCLRAVRSFQRDTVMNVPLSISIQRYGSVGVMLGGLYYFWIALSDMLYMNQ